MRSETFVRQRDGKRKRLPIDKFMTGGKGAQHWLDKGFVRLADYEATAPSESLESVISSGAWEGRR